MEIDKERERERDKKKGSSLKKFLKKKNFIFVLYFIKYWF